MGFFKTPAWAQTQPAKPEEEEDDSEDLFSHKKSFLSIVKQQSERQRKEKEREERRKAKKEEKRKSSEKRKSEEGAEGSDWKKRRITAEESEQLLAKAGVSSNVISLSDDDDDDEIVEQQLPVRRSPRTTRTKDVLSPPKPKSRLAASIDIGNDSDDDIEITTTKSKPAPPPSEPEEDVDSDPEIAEWQRKAREKARAKQQAPNSSTPDAHGTSDLKSSTPPAADPVVKILVTSDLGGTNPLILCRKLSQRLREVREMYCKKQGFSDEFTAKVFLVHRGRQYWDSTTVKRLGLDVDADGRVYRVDDPAKEDVENVHVEAVTQELFEKMKAEKAREAKVASGVPEEEEEEEEEADKGAAEEAPAPTQIRLTVKAKGKHDWKVVVFPTTSIAKIMRAGKKNLKFPDDQNVYIEFDGERLEPDQTIGDTEIEDMYCVDMFVES